MRIAGWRPGYPPVGPISEVARAGCVELLDADEFELHKQKYAYPHDVVTLAEEAAQEVAGLARRGEFPFDQG